MSISMDKKKKYLQLYLQAVSTQDTQNGSDLEQTGCKNRGLKSIATFR